RGLFTPSSSVSPAEIRRSARMRTVPALLLLLCSLQLTSSAPGDLTPDCCHKLTPMKIPLRQVKSYSVTSSTCPLKAVVLHTKVGKTWCVDRDAEWVKSHLTALDKAHKESTARTTTTSTTTTTTPSHNETTAKATTTSTTTTPSHNETTAKTTTTSTTPSNNETTARTTTTSTAPSNNETTVRNTSTSTTTTPSNNETTARTTTTALWSVGSLA
ncbi:hypothetical protein NFI96_016183, partial [Prochilodus magdalenae]